ncbi:MAG: serine protease [Clostridia bacterium]|nr:serine protease [Clostridia bacterium]
MKRLISTLLVLTVLFSCSAFAAGYSLDPDAINESAQSVMLLAVYNIADRLIGTGSGFVAFSDEYLITNCHVIRDADVIVAYTDSGETRMINRVLCADEGYDIAILLFDEASGVNPLELYEGETVRGESVVAIGSPIGFKNTVSIGNLSSAGEDEKSGYLQFTAPISSGSSGGALLNDDGLVIGITSATRAGEDTQNMNFAVSIKHAVELYNAHSADEAVDLKNWRDVNYGEKRKQERTVPDAREFTMRNYAGFSISEIYLYPEGSSNWGKVKNTSGWLYKNESMVIRVTDEEAAADTLYNLNFCFYYNKYPCYMQYEGIDIAEILGRTITIYLDNGNTIRVEIE